MLGWVFGAGVRVFGVFRAESMGSRGMCFGIIAWADEFALLGSGSGAGSLKDDSSLWEEIGGHGDMSFPVLMGFCSRMAGWAEVCRM